MSETPTPPKPPHPADAAKHVGKGIKGKLSGHNKWVYIAGATVLIGVAFLVWQRNRSAVNQADGPSTADPIDNGSPVYYPDASQGAWGGFGDPQSMDPVPLMDPVTPEPLGPQQPVVVNVMQPVPTTVDPQEDTSTIQAVPTGGGTVVPRTVSQHAQPTKTGCPKAFPNRGPHGCFSREYDAHRKKHYHQYQNGTKVWL